MEQADEEEEEGKEEKDEDYTLCWIAANPTVRWVNNTAQSEQRQIYLAFAIIASDTAKNSVVSIP